MGIAGRREGLTGSELMRLTNTFGNLPILSQIVMTVLVKIEITKTIHHRVSIHILCSFITILAHISYTKTHSTTAYRIFTMLEGTGVRATVCSLWCDSVLDPAKRMRRWFRSAVVILMRLTS